MTKEECVKGGYLLEDWNSYYDDFLRHGSDLIPHDDPDYASKILKAAEDYVNFMTNPEEINKALMEAWGLSDYYPKNQVF